MIPAQLRVIAVPGVAGVGPRAGEALALGLGNSLREIAGGGVPFSAAFLLAVLSTSSLLTRSSTIA